MLLRLKCTKFDFGWGPPQAPLGEATALPRLLAGFEGLTSKRRDVKGGNCYKGEGKWAKMRERGRKGTERRRKRKGKEGKERRCAVGIFNYFRLCHTSQKQLKTVAVEKKQRQKS